MLHFPDVESTFLPVCWLCEHQFAPSRIAWITFRPLAWLTVHYPLGVGAPFRQYAAIFSMSDDVGLRDRRGTREIRFDRPFKSDMSPIDCEMFVSGIYR